MKFKSNIELQAGLEDASGSPGTVNQLLSSTATGTAWIDPSTIIAADATLVVIECKNTSGSTITKGTPVYQTGTVGATSVIEIAPADALDSANKSPAIGLLQTDLINNAFGFVVISGALLNFTTSPIDGVVPVTGDKVFLKSGGGLTLTKPTGSLNGIQNLGLIGKVAIGGAGSITVSSIMRTNDVPNLPTGRTWVGNGNTEVSQTVYIDEPNLRLGIGTTSPGQKLHLNNSATLTPTYQKFTNGTATTGTTLGIDADGDFIINNGEAKEIKLYTNDSQRVTIQSGGNVGIGTTAPTEKLHIAGGGAGNIRLDAGGTYYGTNVQAISGAGLKIGNDDFSGYAFFNDAGNVGVGTTTPVGNFEVVTTDANRYIRFKAPNGEERFQFYTGGTGNAAVLNMYSSSGTTRNVQIAGGTTSYFNGGNVGIGTTSPSRKLEVVSSAGIVGVLTSTTGGSYMTMEDSSTTSDSKVRFGAIGDNASIWAGGSARLSIGSTGAMQFNAYNSTNQTGTPTYLLGTDASGNIVKTNTVPGSAAGPYLPLAGGTLTGALTGTSATFAGNVTLSSSVTPTITITDTTNNRSLLLRHANNDAIIESSVNSSLTFNTSGANERMRIDSTGNVGIGTASPSRLLQLNSSGQTDLHLTSTNQGVGASDGMTIFLDASGTGGLWLREAAALRFATSSSERMRIDSSGNVGIGTTAPGGKLQITSPDVGSVRSYTASNGFGLIFDQYYSAASEPGASYTRTADIVASTGDVSSSQIRFLTKPASANPAVAMLISGNSNVGIGTTSPGAKLHVNSENSQGTLIISRGGNNLAATNNVGSITFPADYSGTPTTYASIGAYANALSGVRGSLDFKVKSTSGSLLTGMTVYGTNAGVNVGIGTTSPGYKLSVSGNIGLTDGVSTGLLAIVGGNYYIQNTGAYSTVFQTNGSERMRITSAGNVGIGTTSPLKTLSVNGGDIAVNNGNSFIVGAAITGDTQIGELGADSGQLQLLTESTRDIKFGSTTHGNIMFLEGTNGNVGIGTTSPDSKLEISEPSQSLPTLGTASGNILLSDNGPWGMHIGLDTNVGTGWIQQMRNDSAVAYNLLLQPVGGNVGIGTTSPGEKLDVNGNIKASGTATFGADLTVKGNINIWGNNGSLAGQIQANSSGGGLYLNASGTNQNIRLVPTGTGFVQVTTSLEVTTTGNFGGSITVPFQGNNFIGSSSSNGLLFDGSGNYGMSVNSSLGLGLIFESDGGTTKDFFIGTGSSDPDSATKLLTINSSGNVGIGTTSPGYKLDVSSGSAVGARISTSGFTNLDLVSNRTSGNLGGLRFKQDIDAAQTGEFIGLHGGGFDWKVGDGGVAPGIKMRLDSSGKLGIGTTSPSAKLEVLGVNNEAILTLSRGNASQYLTFRGYQMASNGNHMLVSADDTKQVWLGHQSNAYELVIDVGGNVGIGTTNPAAAAKLTVMGNQTFGLPGDGSNTSGRFISIEGNADGNGEGSGRVFFTEHNSSTAGMDKYGMSLGYRGGSTSIVGASGNTWTGLTQIGNGEWGMFGHDNNATGVKIMQGSRSATYTAFYSSGSETMRVTGGNVGIGTTSPGYKLDVSGTIRATGTVTAPTFSGALSGNATTATTASNANLLDNLDSTQFLRSDATDYYSGGLVSTARNYGNFGTYDSTKTDSIWSMGTSYKNSSTGANFGNLYGLAYKHTNNTTGGTMGGGHQMVWCNNGTPRGAIGYDSVWHVGSMSAPIFYDSNDTSYYLNPASQSHVSTIDFSGILNGNGHAVIGRNHAYDTLELRGYGSEMMIGSQGTELHINYRTCNSGAASNTPTDWYWRAGSSSSYSNHTMGNIHASVSSRAPIFYDSNNTGYYSDPGSTSNLWALTVNGGNLNMYENGTYSSELTFQNNTHKLGIDYQNNETLRFITRSGTTTVPITFQMRAGTITASNFILSSDERKKTKIKDLSCDNIDTNWKSFEMKNNEGEYRVGVIAQELEIKHPEFVNTDNEGFKSVKYIDLLIAKIAELEARLEKAGI